jgi:hypothetical protein
VVALMQWYYIFVPPFSVRNRAAFLEIYQSYADEERAAQRSRARR